MEEPRVISGFDTDRQAAASALRSEPPGTFVVRFSLSQPGSLVITCKAPRHAAADGDGLVHAIARADELAERRLGAWLAGLPGATHVLDTARGARVDKRKVSGRAGRARGRVRMDERSRHAPSPAEPAPLLPGKRSRTTLPATR